MPVFTYNFIGFCLSYSSNCCGYGTEANYFNEGSVGHTKEKLPY